jgi:rhamnosyltransferase
MISQHILGPCKNNICAIIVTFHPDIKIQDRIKLIANQVKKVIIVDNKSSEEIRKELKIIAKDLSAKLILNDNNLGVATALNIGFQEAIDSKEGFEWCLTMDQDTILNNDMVQNLISAYNDCPFREQIGIIGSNYEEYHTGRILFNIKDVNDLWAEVDNLPTSGCLNSINIFQKVGKFKDELFIDYVDTEYCMRIKDHKFRVIISPIINMTHPLGNYKSNNLYKFLTGQEMITNYPPVRHYYWTRNGLSLVRERFWKNTKWALNELYYLIFRRVLIVLIFEDQKLLKLRNILLGFIHSFLRIKSIPS